MVWCSTSPSALNTVAFTRGLPFAHVAAARASAVVTRVLASAYRRWITSASCAPAYCTGCCAATGTLLDDVAVHRLDDRVQLAPAWGPSTHTSNAPIGIRAGPEKTTQPSVYSGPCCWTGLYFQ